MEGRLDLHIPASCGNEWLRHRHSPQAVATRDCDIGWLRQRVAATEDGGAAGPVVDNDAEGPVALVK